MTGRVAGLRPLVEVSLRTSGHGDRSIEFTVDTGFAGFLALPTVEATRLGLPFIRTVPIRLADGRTTMAPLHAGTIVWDGQEREVEIVVTAGRPLVGTLLLSGHDLVIRFADGGPVSIEPL